MKTLNFKISYSRITLFLILTILSSCISQKKTWILQDKDKDGINQFVNSKKTTYRIQAGDYLFIKIYSFDKETSKFFQADFPTLMNPTYLYLNSYSVNEEGYLNFSFIDKIFVKGLTVEEIQGNIQKTMNEYFKDVTVTVKLVNFRISVLGEVRYSREFTITQDQITVLEALALSGGISEFGNRKKIAIIRQTDEGSEMHYIDLTDNKVLESNYYYLMPNDVVYVESLKSKSFIKSKADYGLFISTVALIITVLTFLK